MLDHKAPRNPYRAAVNIHQTRLVDSFALLYPKISKLKINPEILSDLISIDNLNYRLLQDTHFKLNLINHIQFCMTMKVVIRKLLSDEATADFLQDLREKEAEIHFREIDALSAEQLGLARAIILLSQKEKDLVLIAILEERIILSTYIITQLYVEKSKWISELQTRKAQFTADLDTALNQVRFYKNTTQEHKLSIQDKIDRKLFKLEQKGLAEEHEQDAIDYLKQQAVKKIVMKHAQKHEMAFPVAKELEKIAQEAVKLHNECMKDMQDINGRIDITNQQIKKEEEKRDKCVQVFKVKLKKSKSPHKVNQIQEEIKKFHTSTFEKLSQKKASLRAKADEVQIIDEWIIHENPEVFEAVVEREREKLKTMESTRKRREIPLGSPSSASLRKYMRIRQQDLTTKKQNLHSQTDPHHPKKKR